MTRSMTAYGRAESVAGGRKITVELKSVNGRYFDCSIKLPRVYDYLEDKVKNFLQNSGISRGKLDVYITFEQLESSGREIMLDVIYATEYLKALYALRDSFGLTDDITVSSVAANRDLFIVRNTEENPEDDWNQLLPVLKKAFAEYNEMRSREGENLKRDILLKRDNIYGIKSNIASLAGECVAVYRAKLEARLTSVLAERDIEIDSSRILTECAIFADRTSIDEELVRLDSHLEAMEKILSGNEPSGRKLDFLVQEINREANTIGSKTNTGQISALVVDLKSEIEKIREQIQNIE